MDKILEDLEKLKIDDFKYIEHILRKFADMKLTSRDIFDVKIALSDAQKRELMLKLYYDKTHHRLLENMGDIEKKEHMVAREYQLQMIAGALGLDDYFISPGKKS